MPKAPNPHHGFQTISWADHPSRRFCPELQAEHRARIARAVRTVRKAFGPLANWPKLYRTNYRFARTYAGVPRTCCPYLGRLEQIHHSTTTDAPLSEVTPQAPEPAPARHALQLFEV